MKPSTIKGGDVDMDLSTIRCRCSLLQTLTLGILSTLQTVSGNPYLGKSHPVLIAVALLFTCLTLQAAQPRPTTLNVSIDPYPLKGAGIILYQSTSLGSTYSPFKRVTAFTSPPGKTTIQVIPGSYRYYCTAFVQKGTDSPPSNMVTVKLQ